MDLLVLENQFFLHSRFGLGKKNLIIFPSGNQPIIRSSPITMSSMNAAAAASATDAGAMVTDAINATLATHEEADAEGAAVYIIIVVLFYACSIVLFIGIITFSKV